MGASRPRAPLPWRLARGLGAALAWVGVAGLTALAVAHLVGAPASGQERQEAAGERLYAQQCVRCHGTEGQGTNKGPALTRVGTASADFYLRSGRMPIDDPDQQPKRRPPLLEEDEIRALVAYVDELGEGPPIPDVDPETADQSRGADLYRVNCVACHNWDAKGGAMVGGRNAPDLHAVPPTQVAEAVRVGPGPMPRFGEDLLSDEDLDAVVAYVEYLSDPEDAGGFGLGHWGPATEGVAAILALGGLLLVTGWIGSRERA